MWIRLSKICKFSPVVTSLSLYRIHGRQISNDIKKKIEGRKKIIEKYFKTISEKPHVLSWHYRRLGSLCALIGEKKQAIEYFKQSLRADKSNIGSWLHIVLLMLNSRLHKKIVARYGLTDINGIKLIS